MNLQTFKAPTMAAALAKVKSSLGHDAVILHTRTYRRATWLGLRRREEVEITAGQGLNVIGARLARRAPAAARAPVKPPHGHGGLTKQLLDTPAANRAMMVDLSTQVGAIQTMVKQLSREIHEQQRPRVPAELDELYQELIANRVCADLAQELIANLHGVLRPDQLRQPALARERLVESLEKLIRVAGPIKRTRATGPHVIALIGPTGVGKTTTIAKLAANLKLTEKRRVGLVTIDTYRIAAIDQLKKYADILGSHFRVVTTPDELRSAIDSMNDCEFVLIDTAGRSPKDSLKLHELKSFLNTAQPDEVHLVLSTTCSQECLDLAIERFGDVRMDRMIFTKLDEASHAGILLNILHRVNKPLSYITTGQDVPDDIEVANGRRVANLVLGSNL